MECQVLYRRLCISDLWTLSPLPLPHPLAESWDKAVGGLLLGENQCSLKKLLNEPGASPHPHQILMPL